MREYRTSFDGEIVDLDDPSTYKYLPNTIEELRSKMYSEIGYFYCYVNYYNKEIFSSDYPSVKSQLKRVDKLIEEYTKNNRVGKDVKWHQEMLFLFQDEIENMC